MSALRAFCLSPIHRTTPQSPPLCTKPSTFLVVSCSATETAPPMVALPDIPSETKEKILALELLGIDTTKVLTLNPSLSSTPISTIHSTISFLLSKGIRHRDLPRIFGTCPCLLTSDVRTSIAPVFRFLSEDLGVPDSAVRKPIVRCPRLLACSVRDQLKPALIYLRRLGFRDKVALAYRDPVLLASSVERGLIPRLEYLCSLGYTREEAVGMVLRCPGLFTFSIENNLEPKLRYFLEEMKGEMGELRDFPQFFAFSLEKTIEPRHRRVVESGVEELSLPVMLEPTDEEFEMLLTEKRDAFS